MKQVRLCLNDKIAHLNQLFIFDSTLIEICKLSRTKRSNLNTTKLYMTCFCAVQKNAILAANCTLFAM
jgi:hypothetical protein